jgi:hypothetical protein
LPADHGENVRSVGAPGRLLLAGVLEAVRPLEDADVLAAADPRKADAATLKAPDEAIVKNALAGVESVVVIVLVGGPALRLPSGNDGEGPGVARRAVSVSALAARLEVAAHPRVDRLGGSEE